MITSQLKAVLSRYPPAGHWVMIDLVATRPQMRP